MSRFYLGFARKDYIYPIRNLNRKELIEHLSQKSPLDTPCMFKDFSMSDHDMFQDLCSKVIDIGDFYIWDNEIEEARRLGRPLFRDSEILHGLSGKSFPYVLNEEHIDTVKELFKTSIDDLHCETEFLILWCDAWLFLNIHI